MDVGEQGAAVALYLILAQQSKAFCSLIERCHHAADAMLACEQGALDALLAPSHRENLQQWRDANSPLRQQWRHAMTWLNGSQRGLWLAHLQAHDDWPASLQTVMEPPALLFWQGNLDALHLPGVAIVGSRSATPYGLQLAQRFATAFAELGMAVISGLASGIDGAAHQAAVEAKAPTIAVLGSGIDRLYPARHRDLAGQIIAHGGLLVSEFVPGTPPLRHHFPQRNRVISALSLGVLVVEAAANSGSIKTAKWALDLGRSLWAVPGSVHSEKSRGCHALLRDHMAELVESPEQLLDGLLPDLVRHFGPHWQALTAGIQLDDRLPPSAAAQDLLEQMAWQPCNTDDLIHHSSGGPSDVLMLLGELEVLGWIVAVPGGYQRIGA